MAYTPDPNLLSTQEVINAVHEGEQGGHVKASPTSTASLSSSTSKEGGSGSSRKAAAKGRGEKRKASAARTSPCVQAAAACAKPPPIVRRLSADKCHFKDIVHQFTGLPRAPPAPRVPIRNSSALAAAIAQSLQSLDTISAYLLLYGSAQEKNILLNEINKSKSLTFLQSLKHQDSLHRDPMATFNPSGTSTHISSSTFGDVDFNSSCPPPTLNGLDFNSSCPPLTFGGLDFNSLLASHLQNPSKSINMGMLVGGQELPTTDVPSMHKSQQTAELESALHKDNNAPDNLFSLAWVLLKALASQSRPFAL